VIKRGEAPPIIQVVGRSIPEAWENAYLALANHGKVWKRDDERDSGDQIGARMTISVTNPDEDPFTHRIGGTNAVEAPLLDYCYEIIGAKPSSSWMKNFDDPEDNRWDYTYFERLDEHPNGDLPSINQSEAMKKRLIDNPSSRRNNMITWYPKRDLPAEHTPCLQRFWFETVGGVLDVQYEFRSRNVMNASLGNMLGLYIKICDIRDVIEKSTGKKLELMLTDTSNSFHVNSHEFPMYQKLVKMIKKRKANGKERFYTREKVMEGLEPLREEVESSILKQTEKHYKGDMKEEVKRVHQIGDRVFYLLNKYAPKDD